MSEDNKEPLSAPEGEEEQGAGRSEEETTDTDSAEADGGDRNPGEAPNMCTSCEG